MTRLVWDVDALLATLDGATRPQALWDAALAALSAAGGSAAGGPGEPSGVTEVAVVDAPTGAVLWDAETLGVPRPLDPGGSLVSLLADVADTDPRTWAGVLEGRYAAGSLGSYLVARATRGLEHVGLAGAVPDLAALPAGAPDDVLPEVLPPGPVGTTDPACCAGLRVPLLLLLPA
ncbi:hypothetical protein [Nocardioides sp. AX2bis]|uniref:hypothetical protein n=1 Tax=Nocardioides sp. AX2bis TaxID=2653157 RepID=UPI0012EF932A|nr:hypothetical protein [Nocardioides sp. AX2bis]VXB04245.1 hypothetical protein NOCARDAX2BIS_130042 [Nocardioides sp. AX2bis]